MKSDNAPKKVHNGHMMMSNQGKLLHHHSLHFKPAASQQLQLNVRKSATLLKICKIEQNQNKDYGASFTEEKCAFQEEEKIVGISTP